ncbi:MAG TPA: TlpA disulfide reductase family protein [Flavihumibacter sp.]|jgi:peroxiredoxin
MKALSICFGTLFFLFAQALQAQQGNFTIKGSLNGLPDQSIVAISDPDRPTDTLAKSVVKGGSFTLKGSLPDVKLYHISFLPVGLRSILFLQSGNMELEGDINATPMKLQLKGSAPHDDFLVFQQKFEPLFKQYGQISEAANRYGVNDSLMTIYNQLVVVFKNTATSFAAKYKNSQIAPFMWATLLQLVEDPDLIENSFNSLAPAVKTGFYGRFLEARIAEAKIGRVGTQALDFTQNDPSGKPITLSMFRGKYVLVDFWASWCGPCRVENPNVVRAHDRFKSKNFTVLGVSLDNNRDKWLKAIADDRLDWTHVSDLKHWQNAVAVQYRVQSIPQNLLIDPNGIIIARNLRGEELQMKLCELLGCEN